MSDDYTFHKITGAYPTLYITNTVESVISDLTKQKEEYVMKQLVSLGIDPDVLLKQTLEIQRLNDELKRYRWIPVTEQLPKTDEEVLFQDDFGEIFIGRLHINDGARKVWYGNFLDDRVKNVIAWMPLPEPYNE